MHEALRFLPCLFNWSSGHTDINTDTPIHIVVRGLQLNCVNSNSDKEPADMRIEKPNGNKQGKNEMAFP